MLGHSLPLESPSIIQLKVENWLLNFSYLNVVPFHFMPYLLAFSFCNLRRGDSELGF